MLQVSLPVDLLNNLLRIKLFREEMAERELAKARERLRQATEALKTAMEALRDFQKESLQREKAMYADLCSRLVVLREIDDVRTDIELMKEKLTRLNEQVEEKEKGREEAANEAEQARLVHRDAVRMREKYSELLKTIEEEHEIELARLEDIEMEEAAAGRFAFRDRSDPSDEFVSEADE